MLKNTKKIKTLLCIKIITVTSEDFDQILESRCLNEFFCSGNI